MELVRFTSAEDYTAPDSYGRVFSLVRLADLMGVDGFLTFMAEKLDIPVQRITNNNTIHEVRSLMRNRYWACGHAASKLGLCGKCRQHLGSDVRPPERLRPVTTLYCRKDVHIRCHVVDEPSCSMYGQSYTILPCVICLQPIEHPASSPAEAYCRHALPLQMPCCGAEAHEDCHAGFAVGRCCPCHMPLLAGVEGLDEECTSVQDYLFMRRQQALVQQRRTKGQKDYGHPLGKIDWEKCRTKPATCDGSPPTRLAVKVSYLLWWIAPNRTCVCGGLMCCVVGDRFVLNSAYCGG